MVRLHLGCGKRHWDGWINCDIVSDADVVTDIRKLPFPDGYADEVCAIHVFEHFEFWEAPDILKEWRRVLKSGGKLTLELPEFSKCIRLIVQNPTFPARGGGKVQGLVLGVYGLYGDFRERRPEMTHKWCWSGNDLKECLKEAGFRDVRITEPQFHYKVRDMRVEAVK